MFAKYPVIYQSVYNRDASITIFLADSDFFCESDLDFYQFRFSF